MNYKMRVNSGLKVQAICDAVGNPFEFQENIDPDDVVKYANSSEPLVISDDTQMALFGFEAIERAKLREGDVRTIFREEFTRSYLDWYKTQCGIPLFDEGLLGLSSMYSVQAPGNTCMESLYNLSMGLPVINDSKGCGSVMRLLPLVQLFDPVYGFKTDEVVDLAQITGHITHKHVENAEAIETYMLNARTILRGEKLTQWDQYDYISQIGEGWTAQECVDMAIWAVTKAMNFDELLALSIAHDGDSDSVAAVAGSLWGLMGRPYLPNALFRLDAYDAIEMITGV